LFKRKRTHNYGFFRSTKIIETNFGNIVIRPILFSPEKININNADKFINWTEINDFVWLCLCPSDIRMKCGTRYDFTAWGQGFNEIVKAYKDRQKSQTKFETITELYKDIEDKRTVYPGESAIIANMFDKKD